MTGEQRRENFRNTAEEARLAVAGWLMTFAWVVGVSWWVGSERPAPLWFGIPKWLWLGPGIGWLCTVLFNSWFSVRMLGRGASASAAASGKRGPR